jgi:hypothetical protein
VYANRPDCDFSFAMTELRTELRSRFIRGGGRGVSEELSEKIMKTNEAGHVTSCPSSPPVRNW